MYLRHGSFVPPLLGLSVCVRACASAEGVINKGSRVVKQGVLSEFLNSCLFSETLV